MILDRVITGFGVALLLAAAFLVIQGSWASLAGIGCALAGMLAIIMADNR